MLVLTIRTDKPEAEIGLYRDDDELGYYSWQAHRQLAETIHQKIKALLDAKGISLQELEGVVVYVGPGSFTGLRIGVSVANALAYSLEKPVVGSGGEDWIVKGLKEVSKADQFRPIVPEYGAAAKVTKPRK